MLSVTSVKVGKFKSVLYFDNLKINKYYPDVLEKGRNQENSVALKSSFKGPYMKPDYLMKAFCSRLTLKSLVSSPIRWCSAF